MIDTIRRSVRARRKTQPTPPAGLLAGLVGLLVASCATSPTLAPSKQAQRVPGQPHAAVVSSHGIEVVAETEAWSGEPARFDDVVPVLVTITNDGDRPVRVRASDFWLVAESGQRLDGLAPFGVDEVVVQSNDLPIRPYGALSYGHAFDGFHPFAFGRFGHAGHFGHGVPGLDRPPEPAAIRVY